MSHDKKVETTWADVVAPAVTRFEVVSKLGGSASWDAEGSKAMAGLLKAMAAKLDAIARIQIAVPPEDDAP